MTFHDIVKQCKQCGATLQLNNERDVTRKNFCSHACRQIWRYQNGDSHFDNIRHLSYLPENVKKRNLPKGPKLCAHCEQSFDPDSARQIYCKTCVPDKAFRAKMQRYNISKPGWDALSEKQNGKCALCNNPPYAVDHCHTTGRIRGLLCDRCNRLLGLLETGEWPDWYTKAKTYLSSE